jgi:hypothetical protein
LDSGEEGLDNSHEGGLLQQLEDFLEKENDEDAEDGPDWMFEEGKKSSKDATYTFCPAPHRKPLLRLFTKHFCQHPSFPTQDGSLTAEAIHREAVYEMYQFCRTRGLREAWGYFWTSWYAPQRWKLWARSTSPFVSRLRTTMNVENFWKQLKHGFLHNHFRPRLDLLVWVLITKVTPAYLVRAHLLDDGFRLGRSKPLTPFQKQFKAAWLALAKLPLSDDADTKYITSLATWTCTCKALKFHSSHLCKHLVQAVGPPPPHFWGQIVRRRTIPLYRHPVLVHNDDGVGQYIEPTDGSITDGDDHGWSGNRAVLEGGGGWRNFDLTTTSLLGKHARSSHEGSDNLRDEEEVRQQFFPSFDSPDSDDEEVSQFLFMLVS